MKNFCILSGIIVGVVVPCLLLDYFINNGFLDKFMIDQSLSIMGNMLAIYVGIVTAFTVVLEGIEEQHKKICTKTSATLKKNILYLLVIYGAQMLCLMGHSEHYVKYAFIEYLFKGAEILFFSLYFLLLYEITDVFFLARDTLKAKK